MIEIRPGERFAILALPRCHIAENLTADLQVDDDLFVTDTSPTSVSDTWREWLGTLLEERVKKAGTFLIAKVPSDQPRVMEAVSKRLDHRVVNFYGGLRICGWYACYDRPVKMLGGRDKDGDAETQHVALYGPTRNTAGAPQDPIIGDWIRAAAEVATGLDRLNEHTHHRRQKAAVRAFFSGIEERFVEERLHRFVRTIEGFIFTRAGRSRSQFASRTELFIGPSNHQVMQQIHDIRSAVEHLNPPSEVVDGASLADRYVTIFHRTMQAEAIARHCVRRFLSEPGLWGSFESDDSLARFWASSNGERETIWGPPLDFASESARFEPRDVSSELVGLRED